MKREMNAVLQVGVEAEKKKEKEQDKLRHKFGITAKNVVVVERTNMLKFMIRTASGVIRVCASIIVISLAVIGLVALFYEAPRSELLLILWQVYDEVRQAIPF